MASVLQTLGNAKCSLVGVWSDVYNNVNQGKLKK